MPAPTDILSGQPSYDLTGHLEHVRQLFERYPLNTTDKAQAHTLKLLTKICGDRPPWQLIGEISEVIASLYEAEGIFRYTAPTLQERDYLTRRQAELSSTERIEMADELVVRLFQALLADLPECIFEKERASGPTVPLASLTPTYAQYVNSINAHFVGSKYGDNRTFGNLAHKISENMQIASGIEPWKPSSRKLLSVLEYDGDPSDYLRGTAFENFFKTAVPFVIPRKTWAEHGALFGKSGHGKTQTLRAIVANFLNEDDPPALFIIDSLGSLIEGIPDLEVFSTRLKDRLVVVDASDDSNLPSLNFFQLESDDLCFYLFKAIDQSFTQRQSTMIAYLMEYMRHIKDANLLTLINVCESKDNLHPDVVARLSPFAQSFFQNQFYAKKPDSLVQQTKSQIASRIYTLARMPKFQEIFSSGTNAFDPFKCMQEKKIVIINTDARPPRLGGLGEASGIFGRFILALCLDAARGRPKQERHLALLIVDEAKAYLDEHSALILSDARQFGLGMLLATQFPHQLEEGVRREINTNTSIRMMGPVEYAVASQYARDMFTTPEQIMRMRSYDRSHTEWMTYVANMTEKAVKLDVPFGAIEAMPKRAGAAATTTPPSTTTPEGIAPGGSAVSASSVPLPDPKGVASKKKW